MVFDQLFTQSYILETSMQATAMRNDVIQNNIANIDTPGFKKQDLEFESVLGDVINNGKTTGTIKLSMAQPVLTSPNSHLSYRLDGNNVDVDTEMMALYNNSIRYDVYVNSINSLYKRIDTVLAMQ